MTNCTHGVKWAVNDGKYVCMKCHQEANEEMHSLEDENISLRENIDNLKQEMNEYTTAYAREIHLLKQELERYKEMWLVCPLCKGSYRFEEGK